MIVSRTLSTFLFVALIGNAKAAAQQAPESTSTQPSEATRTEARALFHQARTAIQEGRFGSARDLLRRSLALVPNAGSAFNLAVALRGTGELRSALSTFDALLAGTYGALSRTQSEEIATLTEATRADLAHLEVQVSGAEQVEVRLDGEVMGTASEGETLRAEVDPGEHVLLAAAPRRTPYEQRVTLGSGERVLVRAALEASLMGTLVVEAVHPDAIIEIVGFAPGRGSVRQELPPGDYRIVVTEGDHTRESHAHVESGEFVRLTLSTEGNDSIAENPWLWTGIGAAAIGVALAVAIPLTITTTQAPISDPTYAVVMTLSAPLP